MTIEEYNQTVKHLKDSLESGMMSYTDYLDALYCLQQEGFE